MSENRRKLQNLLRELFQFDAADLDFGIYAVMNHKRAEVARFIERDILDAIEGGLAALSSAQQEEAETQYREALRALEAEVADEYPILDAEGDLTAAVIAAGGRTMRQLRQSFGEAKQARNDARLSADLEAQVYNDLYRFFARYYDDGDFIPLRRYGADDKYAVPYNGEEVMLHWANADQYYVKSGEYFTDYRFHLAGTLAAEPAQVVFKLTAATVAQNNVKGEKRFFVLAGGAPIAWDAEGRALTVAFEYRPLTDDEKRRTGTQKQQEKLNAEAVAAILRLTPEPSVRSRLAAVEGDAKPGDERTALARHLARYTARNTRDYFIHKDLGRFLARELDFFLGNEVLKVDDISWSQPGQVRRYALRVQTIRDIGRVIIAFLAQIEDFQRRLWEKRKFVVQSDYCATLDRVPPELYPEIAANNRQRGEWARLYGLELGADADLSEHPYAMMDTAFFDAGFKARLLAAFDNLNTACDGVLVHGENYQALRLLTPRYGGQVKCIYIDPPYNTDAGPIMYKNDYRSSSWLSLLADRIHISNDLLMETGVLCVTIDDYEQAGLHFLLEQEYGAQNLAATVSIRSNPSGRPVPSGFSQAHEYAIFVTKTPNAILSKLPRTEEQAARYRQKDADGSFMWELFRKRGSNSERKDRPSLYYPIYVSDEQVRVPKMTWDEERRVWVALEEPRWDEQVVFPIDDNGVERTWRGQVSNVAANPSNYRTKTEAGVVTVYYKFRPRSDGVLPLTLWADAKYSATEHGTGFLKHYFAAYDVFSYPKSIYAVEDSLRIAGLVDEPGIALDFFAGSGTTGHAVINLNRQEGTTRKFVLVEVGEHFDTVLKPRIQKAVYSKHWRDGKPVAGSAGQSHMFHYLRLESYEDALNNLHFRSLDGPLFEALHEMPDYLLHYMLDYETGGSPSLLDVAQFQRPFAYQLNITRHDVTEPRTIDLLATFNFLLGLRVRTIRRFEREGTLVVRVTGEDPSGRRVCVLWRDVPPLEEMEAEKAWLQAEVLVGVAFDLLYINGESALPGSDVLAIEPEFKRLMFEGVR